MKHLKELMANFYPDEDKFADLSQNHSLVPVVAELPLDGRKSVIGIFEDLFYQCKYAFLLNSGKGKKINARYSFLGGDPFLRLKYQDGNATIWKKGKTFSEKSDPIKSFTAILEEYKSSYFSYLPHFFGGGIGYFSYDLVHYLEPSFGIKKDGLNLPDIHFIFVDEIVAIDHLEKKIKFICLAKTNVKQVDQIYSNLILRLTDRINQYHLSPSKEKSFNNKKKIVIAKEAFQSNVTKKEFEDMVRKVKTYLKEGEIYQANLSQRFEAEFDGDPFILFKCLQNINPSPFSAFLKLDDFFIVSSSPERLVKVYKNRIETRPIAGTRPRGITLNQDKSLSNELLLSEKEKAEHLMLVDLERNDLGRLCKYGSVKVNEFMILERYSHVWHIVSNIKGILKNNINLKAILNACFPGGTITGCPKIRSMEIINEIENISRGLYTGSLGYIGFSGEMDLNIIIRTVLINNGKTYFQVGAGIVADSEPELEFYETFNKAKAMQTAIQNMRNSSKKTEYNYTKFNLIKCN
ncbi:MAG: anthranilate synthase component I family protein [Nitrospinota bacterium]|nr:anthranilate synthase component I family protein [Nitrospinota bacterium]